MQEHPTPTRTPFCELLDLLGKEFDILQRECDYLRSRAGFAGSDIERDLTTRESSGHRCRFTAKSCFPSAPVTVTCAPLVGAQFCQPPGLKAATEEGPSSKGEAVSEDELDTTSGTDSAYGQSKTNAKSKANVQSEHAPPIFDAEGHRMISSPRGFRGRVVDYQRTSTRSSCFGIAPVNNASEPRSNRVAKTIEYIKRNPAHVHGHSSSLIAETILVRLIKDRYFLNVVLDSSVAVIIVFNMVYVGFTTDWPENHPLVLIGDFTFICLFVIERLLKLHVFGVRGYFFGKERAWNIFETLLSAGAIVEFAFSITGTFSGNASTPVVRLFRLTRLAKMLRVLRLQIVKELMLMVNGVVGGVRTLLWSFLLICMPLYVIALILRETAGRLPRGNDDATENFTTLSSAFYTMFRCVVGGDCTDASGRPIFLLLARNHGWQYAGVYMVTLLLMTFGLFNVIVAIYVENTVAAAKYNEFVMKYHRLQNEEMFSSKSRELLELVARMRTCNVSKDTVVDLMSGEISFDYFTELCKEPQFRDILCELDVAEEDQMDLFDTLDVDGGGTLTAVELINGINKLRGDPRRSDIISVGLTLRSMVFSFQRFEQHVVSMLRNQNASLRSIKAKLQARERPR